MMLKRAAAVVTAFVVNALFLLAALAAGTGGAGFALCSVGAPAAMWALFRTYSLLNRPAAAAGR